MKNGKVYIFGVVFVVICVFFAGFAVSRLIFSGGSTSASVEELETGFATVGSSVEILQDGAEQVELGLGDASAELEEYARAVVDVARSSKEQLGDIEQVEERLEGVAQDIDSYIERAGEWKY